MSRYHQIIQVCAVAASGSFGCLSFLGFFTPSPVTSNSSLTFSVPASQFGIICNNSDSTAGFEALHAYLLVHDRTTVTFKPGTGNCTTSDPTWLVGVKNVHIVGNGMKIQNKYGNTCNSKSSGHDAPFIVNTDYFRGLQTDYPVCTTNYATNYRIDSVAVGATSVRLRTPVDASHFPAGSHIWLNGYDQQETGYPPNLRYFEVRTVTSSNPSTGVLGLDFPTENAYLSNWHLFHHGSMGAFGPASVMSLDRSGTIAFRFADSIIIDDVTFLAEDGSTSANRYNGYNTLYVMGIRHFECNRCRIGAFVPQDGGDAILNGGEVYWFEPDKNLDMAGVYSATVHGVTDGVGTNKIIVDGNRFVTYRGIALVSAWSANKYLQMSRNTILGGCVGGMAPTVELTRNNCIAAPGSRPIIYAGQAFKTYTFKILSTPGPLTAEVAYGYVVEDYLKAGYKIATAPTGGKSCFLATDPVDNGENLTLTFSSCNASPAPGDVFSIYTIQKLVGDGNTCGDGVPCNPFASDTYPGRVARGETSVQ